MRKIECRGCGFVARTTREHLAKGLPVCSCGEQWEARCLEDRFAAGDMSAYSGMLDRAAMPHSGGRRTGTHDNRVAAKARIKPTCSSDDLPF